MTTNRLGALTRAGFPAGVRPAAEILSFASPKESIQRKGDPGYAPFGFPALLESRGGCGTRFAQTVLADPPAPSCDPRRSSLEPVRGGASHRATISCLFGGQLAAHPTQASQPQVIAHQWISPVGHAEHRRSVRGSRRGLFERPQDASSAAAARFEKHRATRSRKAEGVTFGSPSLGYVSWRDKKGNVPAGHPRHLNPLRVSPPIQNQPVRRHWPWSKLPEAPKQTGGHFDHLFETRISPTALSRLRAPGCACSGSI